MNRISVMLGKVLLVISSLLFYAYAGWKTTILLGLSIVFNYLFAKVIRSINKYRRAVLGVSIAFNVALLFYFKYFNFAIENINLIFNMQFNLKNIFLPLGMSFITFQQISYMVNVFRGGKITNIHFIDYVLYILYFPKLLMGPIVEPDDFVSQLNDLELKKINWDNISYGLKLFSFGLFKKMIFADTFARAVTWGYENFDTATSMDLLLVMLFYTFEIYFDFSGYSDMAVGTSLMLNITLPINFDSPYKALSIRDFWKRWHMSLTGFLTKYIYIPLGGSKKGRIHTYINTMIVFFISGIWHGANWTFILWGALHGALSVLERIFDNSQKKLMEVVRWGATFLLINILWLLFRSDSIEQWRSILGKIFSFQNTALSDDLISIFELPETAFIGDMLHIGSLNTIVRGLWLLIFIVSAYLVCLIPENNYRKLHKNNLMTMIFAAGALVWSFLCLSSESVFVYLYF